MKPVWPARANVLALRGFYAGEKFALFSANWHVSRVPMCIPGGEDFVTMGSLLAGSLQDNYKVVGFAFHHGPYLAEAKLKADEDRVVDAYIPQADSFEHSLQLFGAAKSSPNFILNVHAVESSVGGFPWPKDLRMNIGEAGSPQSYDATFRTQKPHLQFDGLIFISETNPINVLPEYYSLSERKWGVGP